MGVSIRPSPAFSSAERLPSPATSGGSKQPALPAQNKVSSSPQVAEPRPAGTAAVRPRGFAPEVRYDAQGPSGPARPQRFSLLDPEQALGMALYEGADRTPGAGQRLDLRV